MESVFITENNSSETFNFVVKFFSRKKLTSKDRNLESLNILAGNQNLNSIRSLKCKVQLLELKFQNKIKKA